MEQGIEALAKEIKATFGNDPGIFDVSPVQHFTDEKVDIGIVCSDDLKRLSPLILAKFEGSRIRLLSPIWRTGGLIPELLEKLENMFRDPKFVTHGTKEHSIMRNFSKEINQKEEKIWQSWSAEQKSVFLKKWIIGHRKKDPNYANCGDKFIKP
jgi:hypothetical protein